MLPAPDPHDSLRLDERLDGDRVVLTVRGELDLATVDAVRARMDAIRAECRPLVLDLDALEFIDSTGIRMVLQAVQDSTRSGWEFNLTRGSFAVRRVFAAARIEERLPYADGDQP